MMTVNTLDEKILKAELMQDVFVEGNAIKVYGKIGGLTNLGRTYFTCLDEIEEKRKWAEAQMVQKYGAEIYGSSAQLGTQHSNGTTSNTGRGSAVTTGGSLITCRVSQLMDLSQLNESSGDYDDFKKKSESLFQFLNGQDDDWKKSHDFTSLTKTFQQFRQGSGPSGEDNVRAWKQFEDILGKQPWKAEVQNDKKFRKLVNDVKNSWIAWGGKRSGNDREQSHLGGGSVGKGSDWTPEYAMRIDIQTNFNDEWFQRKFKSGILNAAIMALKTAAQARVSAGADTEWSRHKYVQNEMLPQDKRKLDKIQWNMTNKVAKDFIEFLLGWSRKKVKKMDGDKEIPAEKLKQDSGFGASMAKKALGNRGILGRLKQKLFSGGQSNNVISVAFQLADPNDGWKLIDEKDKPINQDDEDEEAKNDNEANPSDSETKTGPDENGDEKEITSEEDSFSTSDFDDGREMTRMVCEGASDVSMLIDHYLLEKNQ